MRKQISSMVFYSATSGERLCGAGNLDNSGQFLGTWADKELAKLGVFVAKLKGSCFWENL
ncbi:MAG: hypothetical protein KKI09_06535 [Spirochaetes bacterium]|nr:hypothetical protein [Spirochaetota bacterium]